MNISGKNPSKMSTTETKSAGVEAQCDVAEEVVDVRRCSTCQHTKPLNLFKIKPLGTRTKTCSACLTKQATQRAALKAKRLKAKRRRTKKIIDDAVDKEVNERFQKMLAEHKLVEIDKAPLQKPKREAAAIAKLKSDAEAGDAIAVAVSEITNSLAKLISASAKAKAAAE